MAQHDHNLCVPALTSSEEGCVAVGVNCIQIGGVLKEELDTAGVTGQGSCVQRWTRKEEVIFWGRLSSGVACTDAAMEPLPLQW